MPSLVKALVGHDTDCKDCCGNSISVDCGDDSCDGCHGNHDSSDKCVLLRGLSDATNLKLKADPKVVRLRLLPLNSYHCLLSTVSLAVFVYMHKTLKQDAYIHYLVISL